jgi:undecaprenyl-diphosphatase
MWGRLLGKIMRDHWLMLLASVIALAFAVAFAEVGSDVLEGDHKSMDYAVRDWMRSHHTDAGHRIFVVLTHFGDRVVLIPLALAAGWPLLRGHKSWIVLMLFVGLASAELVSLLKEGFGVLRPPIGLQHSKSFAFPSGHTTATATFATVLGYLSLRRNIAPLAYVGVGVVLTVIVGLSRMYLDAHWASDVIGGVLIGSTFAAGCCALFEWLTLAINTARRRRTASSRSLRGEAAAR